MLNAVIIELHPCMLYYLIMAISTYSQWYTAGALSLRWKRRKVENLFSLLRTRTEIYQAQVNCTEEVIVFWKAIEHCICLNNLVSVVCTRH